MVSPLKLMTSPMRLLQEAGLVRHNLIVFALLTAAFNGLVTATIGGVIAQSYSDHHSRRQYVQNINDLIHERHTRARMVLSSLRRGADLDEVRYRKQRYDEAFVEWNKKITNNVLPIREAMGAADTSDIETAMQAKLAPALKELDGCVTRVYDMRIAGRELLIAPPPANAPTNAPGSVPFAQVASSNGSGATAGNLEYTRELDQCQRPALSEFILDCSTGITDELFRFTRLTIIAFGHKKSEIDAANQRVQKACSPPTDASP